MTRARWRLLAGLVVALWLLAAGVGGPLVGSLSSVQNNDSASFLPQSADSTKVSARLGAFAADSTLPLLIVVESDEALSKEALGKLGGYAAGLPELKVDELKKPLGSYLASPKVPVVPSADGAAALLVVSLDADAASLTEGGEKVSRLIVDAVRDHRPDVDGISSQVTGPAGFAADLSAAFAGIDGLLLGVTLVAVLLILLVVYRSPVLPFAVLLTSVFGLALAALVIYPMADADWIQLSGQSQGILFILVVGAATDYSLLLVARYREELHHRDPLPALRTAWRQSLEPIAASGLTVIAGLLCLLLSDLGNISGLGPVGALGIAGAMVASLTFLPAVLALIGRRAFWPSTPKRGEPSRHRGWTRIADAVTRRPRATWVGTVAVLIAAAAFALQFPTSGISQAEFFTKQVESVDGQEAINTYFKGRDQSPVRIVVPDGAVSEVRDVLAAHPIVGERVEETPSKTGSGDTMLTATLNAGSETERARDAVRDLRDELAEVDDAILVGGATATDVDTLAAADRDQRLVIPAILVVVTLILIFLLRSVLAAALLVLINVLTFAATLGVSALLFEHVFGFPGADPSTLLLGFVFLVALAVDYSIFLMSRAREEALSVGTRQGIRRAVAVTGGVITSAGVVLAATFSALSVIPLLFLAQIAFIVAFGVLLDTLVTRSVLVPALTYDLGNRVWWPWQRRMAADDERSAPEVGAELGG
ncbi:MMPL family transporter [Nocardioides sp. Bht2]|uniref:MMPL family transporter n=1 Tax=Nocardioides sp. Bht2 TaxID=3392297 RepID=UPI0039B428C6